MKRKSGKAVMMRAPCLLLFTACLLGASLCGGQIRAQQQQTPSVTPPTERALGVELYQRGDIKGAVRALRSATDQDKADADAWYYLGMALNRDGDAKGARKAVEKSVKLRPGFAPARAGLAYLLLISDKWRDALREAERTLALDAHNAEAGYVISVVRVRQGETEKALDAIEGALKFKPDFPAALLWKTQVLLGLYAERTDYVENESPQTRAERAKETKALLRGAAESLEKYFQLNPTPPNADVWREQLATLRLYTKDTKQGEADTEERPLPPSQTTTRARILTRPEPQYTEEARAARVSGVVVLRGVFAADGTVRNLLVYRSLPHGLTEMAVRAARRIKFLPATKDGRPVSQFIQIEYNFNLY